MDRQLLERMIGAAVLIVALIVIVPAVLDGRGERGAVRSPPASEQARRVVTIRPADRTDSPPVATALDIQDQPEPAPAGHESTAASARLVAPEQETDRVATHATAPPSQPATVPAAKVAAAPKPKAVTSQPATKPVPKTVTGGWAVQLGSFASRDNARRLAGKVRAQGFSAYLDPVISGGRKLYRVRVGPEATRAKADALARRLAAKGFRGQVTRQQTS